MQCHDISAIELVHAANVDGLQRCRKGLPLVPFTAVSYQHICVRGFHRCIFLPINTRVPAALLQVGCESQLPAGLAGYWNGQHWLTQRKVRSESLGFPTCGSGSPQNAVGADGGDGTSQGLPELKGSLLCPTPPRQYWKGPCRSGSLSPGVLCISCTGCET